MFPARVKSSAMDWVHIKCGKANFKYLHFEIPQFLLQSMSEDRGVPQTVKYLISLKDSLTFHVKPPKF